MLSTEQRNWRLTDVHLCPRLICTAEVFILVTVSWFYKNIRQTNVSVDGSTVLDNVFSAHVYFVQRRSLGFGGGNPSVSLETEMQ